MIEIRSYRRVFDLERRVYSVERVRLNPAGIPVRGVLYLLAAVSAMLLLGTVPGVAPAIGIVPWYLSDLALPAALAAVLTLVRIDGRTWHVAVAAMIRRRLRPRSIVGLSAPSQAGTIWHPPALVLLPDGSEHVFRRLRYLGPGAVLVIGEHRREARAERDRVGVGSRRSRTVRLHRLPRGAAAPERRAVIVVNPRVRLDVLAELPPA